MKNHTIFRIGVVLCLLLISGVAFFGAPPPAQAAPQYIGCSTPDLIAAINSANASSEPDTLELSIHCTYKLTQKDNDGGSAPNGLPVISTEMTINGNHATIKREPGAEGFRILEVGTTGKLFLNHITLRGGTAFLGAGISNLGELYLTNAILTDNHASWSGGGIQNDGSTIIENTQFLSNTADIGGGYFNGGLTTSALLRNVLVAGNSAGLSAGVFNETGARTLTLANVTIVGNSANTWGGGLMNRSTSTVNLYNVTIVGNSVNIYNEATINAYNTIIANSTDGPNCQGAITDAGNNLDSDGSCGVGAAADPLLDPNGLQYNGGPTSTLALAKESPALDAGSDAVCYGDLVNGRDQRGVKRNQGTHCDMGAFEAGADMSVHQTATVNPKNLKFNLSITNHGAIPAGKVQVTDSLADSVTFKKVTSSQGNCVYQQSSHTVVCDLGKVSVNETANIVIKTKVKVGTTVVSNKAAVKSNYFDMNKSNNVTEVKVNLP